MKNSQEYSVYHFLRRKGEVFRITILCASVEASAVYGYEAKYIGKQTQYRDFGFISAEDALGRALAEICEYDTLREFVQKDFDAESLQL